MDILLFFFLGASFASFIGLVIDRFPDESILFPASHCETCGMQLEVRDLIPVFSQIINRSRCRFVTQNSQFGTVFLNSSAEY